MSDDILNRWKSRALRAEAQLFRAGISIYDPSAIYSDHEWWVLTLEKKDGSPLHLEELKEARIALGQYKA